MTITTEYFSRLSRPAWLLAGTIIILLVGLTDYLTGEELSVSIFYLLPVAITTWFAGRGTGLFFAIMSAISWLAADMFGGHRYSHPAIPYWNMLVRFGFFLVILIILARLKAAYEHVKTLSSVDPLTGVLNGRAFQERANAEIERARRYAHPFTVAYIDLDNFNEVNDRFGHSTGNAVLCTVADIAGRNLRATDIVARLGGDEFGLLFPETGEESARAVLSKFRDTVSGSVQANGWPVTLSIGAVTFRNPPDSVDRMLRMADALMYEAKHGGKSRMRHAVHEV